jgi:hypothetical protein
MDIYISFALQCYVYIINIISHVTLNIIIWHIRLNEKNMVQTPFQQNNNNNLYKYKI